MDLYPKEECKEKSQAPRGRELKEKIILSNFPLYSKNILVIKTSFEAKY